MITVPVSTDGPHTVQVRNREGIIVKTPVGLLTVGDRTLSYGAVTKIVVGKKSGSIRIWFDSNACVTFAPWQSGKVV